MKSCPKRTPSVVHSELAQWQGSVERRDPRAARSTVRVKATAKTPRDEPEKTSIIHEPLCFVLAALDMPEGAISESDRILLGAAHKIADLHAGAVVALACCAHAVEDFGKVGADRLVLLEGDAFASYVPELRADAVLAAVASTAPRQILFSDDPINGGDVGRRVAARLGERPAASVHQISFGQVVSRGNGGRSDFTRPMPRILLLSTRSFVPYGGERREARPISMPRISYDVKLIDRGLIELDPQTISLPEAKFIVSAGDGVTDWAAFHAMAHALGATIGGSRVVCDAGHLPRDRQVGASGSLVEPSCYLAFGISGAPQHLQGIAHCECVVAVNIDAHSEMMKRADLAVVADAQTVMPVLTDLVKKGT